MVPPPPILTSLAELPRADDSRVRWTAPENLHVTLRFLGDAEPEEVVEAMGDNPLSPARARLGPKVGRLGRNVIMVPVEGLDELAADVRHATASIGQPADSRPFVGHLTLARMRRRGRCSLVGHAISGEFSVRSTVLMSSEPTSAGSRYTELARFPVQA